MNQLLVDQGSFEIKLQYDVVIYINGLYLAEHIQAKIMKKFSIPSSLINLVKVVSSSSLVKDVCKLLFTWNESVVSQYHS